MFGILDPKYDNKDIYVYSFGKDKLVWDKTGQQWFENNTKLEPYKTVVCGYWYEKSLTEPNFALWFLINCAPHILLSLIVLFLTVESEQLLSLLTSYPQLLLSPAICNISFTKDKSGQMKFSRSLTWGNLVIFSLAQFLSLVMILIGAV